MLSVYIHIPFCNNICNYCDFCKMLYNSKYVDKYLKVLEKEIKERYKHEYINSIYIGGGSPSSLTTKQLNKLFDIIKIFKLTKNYEYTIECNVDDLDEDKIKIFKENNINRISLGIESFNNNICKMLGRKHNKDMIFTKINLLKKYFNNIK